MPATVLITESTRRTVRALLVIAAVVAVLIPIGIVTAHGASRLGYTRVDASEALPGGIEHLRLDLDTSAQVTVSTSDSDSPNVTITGVGPRAQTPSLDVRSSGTTTTVSVTESGSLENSQVQVTLPAQDAKDLALEVDGGSGSIDVAGDYKDIATSSDAASVDIRGTAERVTATTDWGAISLSGTFGTADLRAKVGTLDSSDLTVTDKVDASATTGSIDLEFSNDAAPLSGISADTREGAITLSLPRLDMVERRMAAGSSTSTDGDVANSTGAASDPADTAAKDGEKDGAGDDAKPADTAKGGATSAKDLFYQINATSTNGSVDLARSVRGYDVGKKADLAGKTVIPVSATTDLGVITIDQG